MDKIYSIQMLRGIAALLVLVHHFMQIVYNFAKTNPVGDFFSRYGAFGVDIFFTLSGFIMAYTLLSKNTTGRKFAINRILRVVPNYWFYTLLMILAGVFITNLSSANASIASICQSLFFIPHENPDPRFGIFPTLTVGWTLNMEMFFYAMLSVLLYVHIPMAKRLLMASAILIICPVIYRVLHIDFYQAVAGNIRLVEFSFGILLGVVFMCKSKVFHDYRLQLSGLILLLFLSLASLNIILSKIILSSLIIYFAVAYTRLFNPKNMACRLFGTMGDLSYSIYLSHSIVILVVWSFIPQLNSPIESMLLLSIMILITLTMSWISYYFIETKFVSYIKSKMTSRAVLNAT